MTLRSELHSSNYVGSINYIRTYEFCGLNCSPYLHPRIEDADSRTLALAAPKGNTSSSHTRCEFVGKLPLVPQRRLDDHLHECRLSALFDRGPRLLSRRTYMDPSGTRFKDSTPTCFFGFVHDRAPPRLRGAVPEIVSPQVTAATFNTFARPSCHACSGHEAHRTSNTEYVRRKRHVWMATSGPNRDGEVGILVPLPVGRPVNFDLRMKMSCDVRTLPAPDHMTTWNKATSCFDCSLLIASIDLR